MIKFLSRGGDGYNYAFKRAMETILIFESEKEHKDFIAYIDNGIGLDAFKKKFDEQTSCLASRSSYGGDEFQKNQADDWLKIDHKSAQALKSIHNDWMGKANR